MKQQYIEAGRIINTHGVHGELKTEIWLDSPDFMKKFKRIFLKSSCGYIAYTIRSFKTQKNGLILALEKVEDINSAATLKGKTFYIDRDEAMLPEGSYFLADIIGFKVINETGELVGILDEIIESPASLLYVVRGTEEHLIPGVDEFIRKVDLENEQILVHMIEGL